MKRFIKEYANEKERRLYDKSREGQMTFEEWIEASRRLNNIVQKANRGLLTIDDAMIEIARA